MKNTEVIQSEERKYKSYQPQVIYGIISLVIETTFIFTSYTQISLLIMK